MNGSFEKVLKKIIFVKKRRFNINFYKKNSMQTTLILQYDDTAKIQQILNLAKQLKMQFQLVDTLPIRPSETDNGVWDADIYPIIQQRLIQKYVVTGEWEAMDDDERQDASLLEKMLYDKEQPNYEVYSEADTKTFLTHLKKELYAVSGH